MYTFWWTHSALAQIRSDVTKEQHPASPPDSSVQRAVFPDVEPTVSIYEVGATSRHLCASLGTLWLSGTLKCIQRNICAGTVSEKRPTFVYLDRALEVSLSVSVWQIQCNNVPIVSWQRVSVNACEYNSFFVNIRDCMFRLDSSLLTHNCPLRHIQRTIICTLSSTIPFVTRNLVFPLY